MVKRGMEYALSREKHAFDLLVVGAVSPALLCANFLVKRLTASAGISPFFDQERVGQGQRDFLIHKFQTKDPETGKSLGRWADIWRSLGLDEIAQLRNVREGTMSVVGRRPIVRREHEQVLDGLPPRLQDPWREIALLTRPGCVSSYAIDFHGRERDVNEFERRAELDIKDNREGSMVYDAQLLLKLAISAVSRFG